MRAAWGWGAGGVLEVVRVWERGRPSLFAGGDRAVTAGGDGEGAARLT